MTRHVAGSERERATSGGLRPDLSARERHALAVRQSLRWADLAAAAGNYENALAWLATVEAIEDVLPPGWERRRQAWCRASDARLPRQRGERARPRP